MLAESPTLELDIFRHAPKSSGAQDYQSLAEELACSRIRRMTIFNANFRAVGCRSVRWRDGPADPNLCLMINADADLDTIRESLRRMRLARADDPIVR